MDYIMEIATTTDEINDICERICVLGKQRNLCNGYIISINNRVRSFIVQQMDYYMPDENRTMKEAHRLATQLRKRMEKQGDISHPVEGFEKLSGRGIEYIVEMNRVSRSGWDKQKIQAEKDLIELASKLPANEFVADIKGVTPLGLAVVVANAGNLSNYDKFSKLEKRLGLAVIDNRRQGNPVKGTAEEWIYHGYKPSRRAEMFMFFSDSMIRSQRLNGEDNGRYGSIYSWKKRKYIAEARKGWTPKHIDNAARRYASKKFLRDLWKYWLATYPVSHRMG
jgi:hypothetical protein